MIDVRVVDVIGFQGQGLSDVGMGDGVEVAVESDVGCPCGADGADEFGLEGVSGEREHSELVSSATVRSAISGVAASVGDLVPRASELGVEVAAPPTG